MQDSLLLCLVKAMLSKIDKVAGHRNPEFTPKAMNFFVALDSMSKMLPFFASANLFGPAIISIQQVNVKLRGSAFVICDGDTITARLAVQIVLIFS